MVIFVTLLAVLSGAGSDCLADAHSLSARLFMSSELPALHAARSATGRCGAAYMAIDTPDNQTAEAGWRRGIFRDLGYVGKTAVGDLTHVYSAPARINNRSLLWVGGILAVGGVIFIYDREIHAAFQRSRDDPLYKPIRKLGESFSEVGYMGTTNRYYLGGMAVGYLIGCKPLFQISAEILESQLIAGVAKDAANITVGRRRPFENEGPRSFKFNDGTSFPSGHAKNVMSAASIISNHIDFLPVQIAAYGIAGSVCLERITSDGHWPSDVYFAAVYGWIVAETVFKHHLGPGAEISPVLGDNTVGLKLSYFL